MPDVVVPKNFCNYFKMDNKTIKINVIPFLEILMGHLALYRISSMNHLGLSWPS